MYPQTTPPRVPGRYLKRQKIFLGPLVANCNTKRVKTEKCSLFDTLPVEILLIVDDWDISFEYNYKWTVIMNRIIQKKLSFVSFHTQN